MKLYNRTGVPDEVLKPLLAKAGRAVGARTSKVVVIINGGGARSAHGTAKSCAWVRVTIRKAVRRWSRKNGLDLVTKRKGLHRRVQTDGGYFKICLPVKEEWYEPLALAEAFFRVARHEWAHIRDFQAEDDGARLAWNRTRPGRRRARWADRPQEIRAEAACDDADALGRGTEWAADEIVDLAVAIEAIRMAKEATCDIS